MRPLAAASRVLALCVLGTFTGCAEHAPVPSVPLPATLPTTELVVLVRPGPSTYYEGPDGQPAGFDVDLMRLFAARKELPVRFVPATSAVSLVEAIAHGRAHIGAGGLYRPGANARDATGDRDAAPNLLWSSGYLDVEPVLVYNTDGAVPRSWNDLAGARVAYVRSTGLDAARLRSAHPEVQWDPQDVPSGEALLAEVSDGRIDYAVVPSNLAAVARNVFLDYEVGFAVDSRRQLGFALPPDADSLRDDLDRFIRDLKRDGSLQRLVDRHFGHAQQVRRMDAGILQERIRSVLPQFRHAFELAQQTTGMEWRLLAAVAYQESQWDPLATSETGVRGIMQLTEDTAKHLGVIDRLEPRTSILAAAKYLRTLKDKLPSRIAEPDRTWFALAAFNIGHGHLEDARVLAQKLKLNPDSWSDVKKTLPMLADPDYYEQAKLGYARGGMPVAFVDRVRAYYDVLLAHQASYRPKLQAPASVPGQRAEQTVAPARRAVAVASPKLRGREPELVALLLP